MLSKRFTTIVERVIQNHGPVLDLRQDPALLLDILRELGSAIANEPYPPDNPCGGTPPSPGPGPGKFGRTPTNEDIYRAVQTLTRKIDLLTKSSPGRSVTTRKAASRKSVNRKRGR
jgi:hypothetical protein